MTAAMFRALPLKGLYNIKYSSHRSSQIALIKSNVICLNPLYSLLLIILCIIITIRIVKNMRLRSSISLYIMQMGIFLKSLNIKLNFWEELGASPKTARCSIVLVVLYQYLKVNQLQITVRE